MIIVLNTVFNTVLNTGNGTCQEEADEVLGSKKKGESQETTLNNENLYLSQAHHYQLCDKPAASLRCINYALGR